MLSNKILYIVFFTGFAAMLGLGIVSPLMPVFEDNLGANGFYYIWTRIKGYKTG